MRFVLLVLWLNACGSDSFDPISSRELNELHKAYYLLYGVDQNLAAEKWGEYGRKVYPVASEIQRLRSPKGEPLSWSLKETLRPRFGSLVDRVKIHWNSPRATELYAGLYLPGDKADFRTFGYDIYSSHSKNEIDSRKKLKKILHEMTHVKQYERHDSIHNFGYHYFKKYHLHGRSYYKNPMEKEAMEIVKFEIKPLFRDWLMLRSLDAESGE